MGKNGIPKAKNGVKMMPWNVKNGFWKIKIPLLASQNVNLHVHFSRFIPRFRNTDALFVLLQAPSPQQGNATLRAGLTIPVWEHPFADRGLLFCVMAIEEMAECEDV
jgi:hypothetical protein